MKKMADPTIQTFCCHTTGNGGNGEDLALSLMSEFNTDSYNAVCITSSTIGIIGAIYQILPRERPSVQYRWHSLSPTRGRQIIIWLAVADLLASLGVFIRSSLWLRYKNIMPMREDNTSVLFCAITSAWTQYFYTATWLWTLFYAIDTWLILKGRDSYKTLYHSMAWGLPAALTSVGLSILYIPDADCHNLTSLRSALLRILPNYCATYIPIATVMVANPIIYLCASKNAEVAVSLPLAQFTSKERRLVDALKLKFALINVSFYICWLPNLINGILMWTLWFHIPSEVIIVVWYIMAVTNPLQALLNAIVYRRWSSNGQRIVLPETLRKRFSQAPTEYKFTERTPLLSSEPPPRLQLNPLPSRSINVGFETL